jgi:PEP-CTERM motif-containing protein
MKRALQIASLTGIMLVVSVCSASADTLLHYVVSGPLGSASFDLLQHPTLPTLKSFSSSDFTVTVHNGSINLMGYSFSAPPFDLEFSNASDGGGFALVVPILGEFQLKGSPMFTGLDSAPTLSIGTGTFLLDNGLVKVAVTDPLNAVPEPSSILLLGMGVLMLSGVHLLRRFA